MKNIKTEYKSSFVSHMWKLQNFIFGIKMQAYEDKNEKNIKIDTKLKLIKIKGAI